MGTEPFVDTTHEFPMNRQILLAVAVSRREIAIDGLTGRMSRSELDRPVRNQAFSAHCVPMCSVRTFGVMVSGACYESIYRPCHRAMLNTSPTELAAMTLPSLRWVGNGQDRSMRAARRVRPQWQLLAEAGAYRQPWTLYLLARSRRGGRGGCAAAAPGALVSSVTATDFHQSKATLPGSEVEPFLEPRNALALEPLAEDEGKN